VKLYAVIFVSGLIIGALGYALIAERNAPSAKPYIKTVTTTIEKTKGVPDTTINEKRETKKVKIKKTGTTEFKLNKNEPGISKITVEQSNNDSNEVAVEFQYPETTIKQVDQVKQTTSEKDSTAWVERSEKESSWQIAVGSIQYWNNQIDVDKYAELSYQKKIWFFYLKGSAGIHNKLNDALSSLKMHTKVELNFPLN
jgi:hypothetical protein